MNDTTGQSQPYYRAHVFCCIEERPENHPLGSCHRAGAMAGLEHLHSRVKELELEGVRINNSGCLGRCDHGPAIVVYPEGIWYRCENSRDAERILQEHILGGKPVKSLMLGSE